MNNAFWGCVHACACVCVVLPFSYGDFQAYTRQKKNKTYILKPESGCQGRGIWITRSPKDIKPHEHMICQVYTSRVSSGQLVYNAELHMLLLASLLRRLTLLARLI